MRKLTRSTAISMALAVTITVSESMASPNGSLHPIGKIGSTVYVNIGALRCPNLRDLNNFKKFFHEEIMRAMDDAADRCLPDTVAKTPEEEATGQRVGVLEQRDGTSEAQCVREVGSTKCAWVMDSQVDVEEDKRD